jgi:hypothetical protein
VKPLVSMKAQSHIPEPNFFKPLAGEEEKTIRGGSAKPLQSGWKCPLRNRGVEVEGAIPEDFGWVVMISRKLLMLWLGCGNTEGSAEWSVFRLVEPSLIQRLFKCHATELLFKHSGSMSKAIVPTIPAVTHLLGVAPMLPNYRFQATYWLRFAAANPRG